MQFFLKDIDMRFKVLNRLTFTFLVSTVLMGVSPLQAMESEKETRGTTPRAPVTGVDPGVPGGIETQIQSLRKTPFSASEVDAIKGALMLFFPKKKEREEVLSTVKPLIKDDFESNDVGDVFFLFVGRPQGEREEFVTAAQLLIKDKFNVNEVLGVLYKLREQREYPLLNLSSKTLIRVLK